MVGNVAMERTSTALDCALQMDLGAQHQPARGTTTTTEVFCRDFMNNRTSNKFRQQNGDLTKSNKHKAGDISDIRSFDKMFFKITHVQ